MSVGVMQSVIRSSEKRVTDQRKTSEAARARAFQKHFSVVVLALILVGAFVVSNIILLRSFLQQPFAAPGEDGQRWIGPLLRERLRKVKSERSFSFGRRKSVSDNLAKQTAQVAQRKAAQNNLQTGKKNNSSSAASTSVIIGNVSAQSALRGKKADSGPVKSKATKKANNLTNSSDESKVGDNTSSMKLQPTT